MKIQCIVQNYLTRFYTVYFVDEDGLHCEHTVGGALSDEAEQFLYDGITINVGEYDGGFIYGVTMPCISNERLY